MSKGKPQDLKTSELARFERNLENFAKLNPEEALFHRFQGIVESQVVTLQLCGIITQNEAIKLHLRLGEVLRSKRPASDDAE